MNLVVVIVIISVTVTVFNLMHRIKFSCEIGCYAGDTKTGSLVHNLQNLMLYNAF